jgi:hypothetical protein
MTETEALDRVLAAARRVIKAQDDEIDKFLDRFDVFAELIREITEERDSLLKQATTPATGDWRDVVRDLFLEGNYESALSLMAHEAIKLRVAAPHDITCSTGYEFDDARVVVNIAVRRVA